MYHVIMYVLVTILYLQRSEEGDEVLVFGKGLPIQKLAKLMDTITYEALTGISSRVKRVYFQE